MLVGLSVFLLSGCTKQLTDENKKVVRYDSAIICNSCNSSCEDSCDSNHSSSSYYACYFRVHEKERLNQRRRYEIRVIKKNGAEFRTIF